MKHTVKWYDVDCTVFVLIVLFWGLAWVLLA
jgi:hypothetical protein